MFKLLETEDFHWPVAVPHPQADGSMLMVEFTAIFRRLPEQRLLAVSTSNRELAEAVLVGWEDVFDRNGNVLLPSRENMALMLDHATALPAIAGAYWNAMNGAAYKRKNSESSVAASAPAGPNPDAAKP